MWKKLEARKNTRKSGRLPARLVHVLLDRMAGRKKTTDEKKLIGAEALNTAGKTTPPKNLPIL